MYIPVSSTLRRSPRIAAKRAAAAPPAAPSAAAPPPVAAPPAAAPPPVAAPPAAAVPVRDNAWYIAQLCARVEAIHMSGKNCFERIEIAIEFATFLAKECVSFVEMYPRFLATIIAKFCSFKAQFPNEPALIAACDTVLRAFRVDVEHFDFTPNREYCAAASSPALVQQPTQTLSERFEQIRSKHNLPLMQHKRPRACSLKPVGFYKE